MTTTSAKLLEETQAIVAAKHQSNHPVLRELVAGNFSPEQVQEYFGQRSCIPLYNHRYHGSLYVRCPDAAFRVELAEVVFEEATGRLFADGVSHHELYLRLGEAIGIPRHDLLEWPLCPEAKSFVIVFEEMCNRSFLEGVAAHMLGAEASVPGYAADVGGALRKHYGLTEEDVKFWTVHEEADAEHSAVGVKLLDRFARTENDRQVVRDTVEEYVNLQWMLLDGIYRSVMNRASHERSSI